MPISAVAGTWAAMRPFEEIFFSGTHGGETLSLAAARAVLDTLADGTVLKDIADRGQRLARRHARRAWPSTGSTSGCASAASRAGPWSRRAARDHLVARSWVQQCMVEHGVLFNGSMFICARHTDADIDRALDAFSFACAGLADGRRHRRAARRVPRSRTCSAQP